MTLLFPHPSESFLALNLAFEFMKRHDFGKKNCNKCMPGRLRGIIFGLCFLKATQPQMVAGWRSKARSLQSTRDPSRASARTQRWEG